MSIKDVTDKNTARPLYYDKYMLAKALVRAYEDLHDVVPDEMVDVFNSHVSKRERESRICRLSTRRVIDAVILERARIYLDHSDGQNEIENGEAQK